jgi:hypothetical protein
MGAIFGFETAGGAAIREVIEVATGRIGNERRNKQQPQALIFSSASSAHSSLQRAGQRPLCHQEVGCLDAPQQAS